VNLQLLAFADGIVDIVDCRLCPSGVKELRENVTKSSVKISSGSFRNQPLERFCGQSPAIWLQCGEERNGGKFSASYILHYMVCAWKLYTLLGLPASFGSNCRRYRSEGKKHLSNSIIRNMYRRSTESGCGFNVSGSRILSYRYVESECWSLEFGKGSHVHRKKLWRVRIVLGTPIQDCRDSMII